MPMTSNNHFTHITENRKEREERIRQECLRDLNRNVEVSDEVSYHVKSLQGGAPVTDYHHQICKNFLSAPVFADEKNNEKRM